MLRERGSIWSRVCAVRYLLFRRIVCSPDSMPHANVTFSLPISLTRFVRFAGELPGRAIVLSKQIHCHRDGFDTQRSVLGRDCARTKFVKSLAAAVVAVATSVVFAPAAHAGPFDVTPLQDIDMGTVGPDADLSGTASIDTSSVISTTGGVVALSGTPTVGIVEFSVATGFPSDTVNTTFSVTSSITLTGSAGGSITFDNIQHDQPASQILTKGVSFVSVQVTGRANVSANQTAGTYTGSLIVTASNVDDPLQFDTSVMSVTMLVVQPIAITIGTLNFGKIAAGTSNSVIRYEAVSSSATGNVSVISGDAIFLGENLTAGMSVFGEPFVQYTVILPAGPVTISNGGHTMTVQNFNTNAFGTISPFTHIMFEGGRVPFGLGADLVVGANQEAGTYTGTFSITATYD